ncbi:MAG: glycosyltransferase, partial [Candidatus Binatia bacterium]
MSTPPRNLRIVSSSVVPAYCNEGEQDRRRLGLPIRQIVLRSDTGHIAIQHDNPWLVEGFHAAEGTHRWTDGYAGVPPHILRCLAGPLTVELYLGARKQLARDILSNNRDEPSPPDPAAPPRALFVDARVPTPDQDAGSNVIYEQMRVVQSLGFAVTFLAPADPALPSKYIDSLHEVGIDIVQTNSELAHERFLQEKGSQFTLAYLHRFDVAERCIALLRFHAPRTVLIFNNADMHFLRMQRQARLTGMAEHLAFAESIKKREMSVSRAVDCTLICNLQEQEILRQEAPDALSHYLPWIIEACIEPLPAYRDRTDLMFIGGFNHPPNLDGVLWFLSEVFPTVQQLLPEVRLHIYGSAIPASLIELASDRVVIGGHVADLAVAFDRHRVSIAPLRFGAGFKGKLAASLAHGVPSVVTPIGAEGTGLNDGEHVLVAEDA